MTNLNNVIFFLMIEKTHKVSKNMLFFYEASITVSSRRVYFQIVDGVATVVFV